MLRQLSVLVHLLAAITWIGGMFFAYFCLRPAAAEVLPPPLRLPLWAATFRRFLRYSAVAVVVLLATGLAMFMQSGPRHAPLGWHVMLTLGFAMAGIFGYVYVALYPELRDHCAAGAWPAAGKTLNRIRQLVALNLALGVATVVAAISPRF